MDNDASKKGLIVNYKNEPFAGSASCVQCHKQICDSNINTAHYLTSRPASEKTIKGSFDESRNKFYYNPAVFVAAEKKQDHFYQTSFVDGREKESHSIDIAIGSGKRGQTFASWYKDNYLLQLPLTYFTLTDEWTNSPGFSNRVIFKRPITSRCLECHSTFFKITAEEKNNTPEKFSKTEIIYGVDCEKCHGPAAEHVAFHLENPSEKVARYIINPGKMTRQQSLDMCRLCHGGRLAKTKPSFQFKPGDALADFFLIDSISKSVADIDVHGGQYSLMNASKCFKGSQMTCLTCHNSHGNETGKPELFSQRCMSCHSEEHNNFCKLAGKEDVAMLKNNCIDCHMPELPSKAIMVLRQGEAAPTSAYMRTHYITVYPEISQKILLNKKKKA